MTAPAERPQQPAPSDAPWTIRRVLAWTAPHFEKKGVDAPRLTAEILLAHVLSCDRVRLYVDLDRPLSKEELAGLRGLIERRIAGEPTQYLTGRQHFYGRVFQVDARVLVPRPETELLVEAALRGVPKDAEVRFLDLCTGSGCVAVTLAAERPRARVWAVDVSPGACEVARANAAALGVAERVTVLQGDLFAALPAGLRFEAIASNPPYVASAEVPKLSAEVRREPLLALDGGPDGLSVIRRIADEAQRHLVAGGLLALEIGEDEGERVRALLEAGGYRAVRVEKDLARHDRLALGCAPGGAA